MPYQATAYKVMIASPSDVSEERDIVRQEIYKWNAINSDSRKIILLPVGWETHSAPEMGERPQEIINKQILGDCDLLVGIFWTRLGTPTGKYDSGTVEEIFEHINKQKPAMLYFSKKDIPQDRLMSCQIEALSAFKKKCAQIGLIQEYESIHLFREIFFQQLSRKIISSDFFLHDDSSISISESAQTAQETHAKNSDLVELFSENDLASTLSNESILLLAEASQDPHGSILNLDYLGGSEISTNNKQLHTGNDPKSHAIWTEALESLEKSGLISTKSNKREIFKVTKKGYDLSEKIKSQRMQ